MEYFVVSHLPIIRRISSQGVTTSWNFLFSFSVALTVISVAWIAYRPALGAGLLMAAVSPMMYSIIGVYNGPQYYNRL